MKSSPKEAVLLPYVNYEGVKMVVTQQGEPNLSVNGFCLHSPVGAKEEARQWFASLDLEDVTHLVVYGIGLGYGYEAAVGWLKKKRSRRLIFLEDSLPVIGKLLTTELGTKLLKNSRTELIYMERPDSKEALEKLYWNVSMAKVCISALNAYATDKAVQFHEIEREVGLFIALHNATVDEYLRLGVGFHLNFFQNLLSLHESALGNDLFGKFKRVPAIICGAGPSLEKQLPWLKKNRDRAIIFAAGSSLNVLSNAGMKPHFGAGIDPNPTQEKRLRESLSADLPFFYRNRMHHAAFKLIQGPKLYITGAGGFNTPGFFEKHLDIEREWIDEGHNVINFVTEIAVQMGCSPIIFVGMDLAFTNLKPYAAGVEQAGTIDIQSRLDAKDEDTRILAVKDIFGQTTYTQWKWVVEAKWTEDFAKTHPEVVMINCTEGGIGFAGVPNRALQEVAKEQLTRNYDLEKQIAKAIQAAHMPGVTSQKIRSLMKELADSLRRVVTHLDLLLQDAEQNIQRVKAGEAQQESYLTALAETEIGEEEAYEYVLLPFNEMIGRSLAAEFARIHVMKGTLKKTRLLKLKQKKFSFLRNVAIATDELITYILSAEFAKKD